MRNGPFFFDHRAPVRKGVVNQAEQQLESSKENYGTGGRKHLQTGDFFAPPGPSASPDPLSELMN